MGLFYSFRLLIVIICDVNSSIFCKVNLNVFSLLISCCLVLTLHFTGLQVTYVGFVPVSYITLHIVLFIVVL